MNQLTKAELLRKLHAGSEPLLLANAWDAASARLVAAEGYPAIASSSAGCAGVLGYPDGQRIPRREMVFLLARIVQSVDVPVTADIEAGYDDPAEAAGEVIDAGAVGLNLEDMVEHELLPLDEQLARIRAVRACAASKNVPLVINARTDIFLAQHGDAETRFERSVERLNAYRSAGADCLFAPGVQDHETIGRLVVALSGPLNILATIGSPSIAELKQLGVARISLGSGTWRIALEAARRFARELRDTGTFSAVEKAIPYAEMQELLRGAITYD